MPERKRPLWQMPHDIVLQNLSSYRASGVVWQDSPHGTACNRCGGCCEEIHPSSSVPDLHAIVANPYIAGAVRHQAEILLDMLEDRIGTDHGRPSYTCRHFDRETRLCGIHDSRPDMCRGYPWYNRIPHADAYMPAQCSFQADLRKQLPIVAVTSGGRELSAAS